MAAIVATAPPLARDRPGSSGNPAGALRLRVLSAVVLAPVGLAAAWFGPPLLSIIVILAAGLMAWEWGWLCRSRGSGGGPIVTSAVVAVVASVLAAALGASLAALAIAVLGSVAVGFVGRGGGALLVGLGVLWIALPCIALLWLAFDPDPRAGRATILWILFVVWATDIGAFAAGRTIGGPRLAPRLSPNKTWSGVLGGGVCAAAAGAVTALLVGSDPVVAIALLSAALAVVAQSGDLAESVAKRHFGVKDSSHLIPGHGGLLDRLDGMLAVIPAVALLSLFGGGSVLTWR